MPKKTSKCWTHHLLQYFSQLKLTLVRDTWVSLISTFLRLWFQSLFFVPNVNLSLAKILICLLFIFYNQIANVPNSKSLFCMLYKQNWYSEGHCKCYKKSPLMSSLDDIGMKKRAFDGSRKTMKYEWLMNGSHTYSLADGYFLVFKWSY